MRLLGAVLSDIFDQEAVGFLPNKLKLYFHGLWTFYGTFSREISKAHLVSSGCAQ